MGKYADMRVARKELQVIRDILCEQERTTVKREIFAAFLVRVFGIRTGLRGFNFAIAEFAGIHATPSMDLLFALSKFRDFHAVANFAEIRPQ